MSTAPLLQFNPTQRTFLFDDFLGNITSNANIGNTGFSGTSSGAGATPAHLAATDAIHHGILNMPTGTSATGRTAIVQSASNATGTMRINGGTLVMEWLVQFPTLSNGTDRYAFRCGWGDSVTADFANGVYFEYDDSLSANWRAKTANASTRTTVDSGVVIAAATWYKLTMTVSGGGTSAVFAVNGTNVATTTTNIPTIDVYPGANIIKSIGTNSRQVYIDYFYMNVIMASAR